MSLITYGFYSGARFLTESIEFKINLIDREIITFKKIAFEKRFNLIERDFINFKIKNNETFNILNKDEEIIKWKIL